MAHIFLIFDSWYNKYCTFSTKIPTTVTWFEIFSSKVAALSRYHSTMFKLSRRHAHCWIWRSKLLINHYLIPLLNAFVGVKPSKLEKFKFADIHCNKIQKQKSILRSRLTKTIRQIQFTIDVCYYDSNLKK